MTYSYDTKGNLTNDGTRTYTYDCENRLTQVNTSPVMNYKYDFADRRVRKYRTIAETRYCYDGDQIIAEYSGAGTLLRKFVYGLGIDEPICMIDVGSGDDRANVHIIMMLKLRGGRGSAELFRKLAQNEEFSERHRKYMIVAAATIERRLARQQQRG